jgi:hypothetical protein
VSLSNNVRDNAKGAFLSQWMCRFADTCKPRVDWCSPYRAITDLVLNLAVAVCRAVLSDVLSAHEARGNTELRVHRELSTPTNHHVWQNHRRTTFKNTPGQDRTGDRHLRERGHSEHMDTLGCEHKAFHTRRGCYTAASCVQPHKHDIHVQPARRVTHHQPNATEAAYRTPRDHTARARRVTGTRAKQYATRARATHAHPAM